MRITALLTILCWMVIFMGCPKQEPEYCYTPTPFDSLMKLGDSAIKVLSIQRIEERQMVDSLHNTIDHISHTSRNEIQGYATQLQQKHARRIRMKDSIIYVRKYDTIIKRIEIVITDTIHRDTIIYNSIFKRKLF
tara:strand:- start:302 stop:706 length:405 start_codon:yes stop_codon:yes gene_type:complete